MWWQEFDVVNCDYHPMSEVLVAQVKRARQIGSRGFKSFPRRARAPGLRNPVQVMRIFCCLDACLFKFHFDIRIVNSYDALRVL